MLNFLIFLDKKDEADHFWGAEIRKIARGLRDGLIYHVDNRGKGKDDWQIKLRKALGIDRPQGRPIRKEKKWPADGTKGSHYSDQMNLDKIIDLKGVFGRGVTITVNNVPVFQPEKSGKFLLAKRDFPLDPAIATARTEVLHG